MPRFEWKMDANSGHITRISRNAEGDEEKVDESDVKIKSFKPSYSF